MGILPSSRTPAYGPQPQKLLKVICRGATKLTAFSYRGLCQPGQAFPIFRRTSCIFLHRAASCCIFCLFGIFCIFLYSLRSYSSKKPKHPFPDNRTQLQYSTMPKENKATTSCIMNQNPPTLTSCSISTRTIPKMNCQELSLVSSV